ncbi:peptidoglycan-binding domain-containing protein [Stackebrandtia soli]|uniref:peptidoglycan-binding domain-containing protein n=1 Tax=Stackebrandtia soli TaxID=1892856 RepID=UPI0039EAF5DF
MSFRSGKGRLRILTVAAAAAVVIGVGVPAAMADTPAPPAPEHKANAQLLDAKCAVPPNHDPAIIRQIHGIAQSRGVTDKVMLAAFEAGWVESHMNNLNCGDRDSLGVFQQRPSQGWCDPASLCLDVNHATNRFLDQAIPNDRNNPGYTAGQLAQSVQRSAYPERYDQAEAKARAMIAEAGGTPAPGPSWPNLKVGSTGADVVAAQHLLTAHGHSTSPDGDFGPATDSSVKAFQTAKGLSVDGVIGPQTWSTLIINVSSGDSGAAVKALQAQLNAHGANLSVDGAFGPATKEAVSSFQSTAGITVDGLVGPQTWLALIGS